jgi:peroxiredoxin
MTNLLAVDWTAIPTPENDGTADHLQGTMFAPVLLSSTEGGQIDVAALAGLTVIYAYPMTGQPDVPLPPNWDMIPGARGCTPQSCAFRDHFAELRALGVRNLFGLSTQSTDYQAEAAARLHLPFPLLSDADNVLIDAMRLPYFETSGMRLLKRCTLIVRDGLISKVFYPVFPPDQNAQDVIDYLGSQFTL